MQKTKWTDDRMKIMNEILAGIQVIKMYAWEKSFAKLVDQIRKWVIILILYSWNSWFFGYLIFRSIL